MNEITIRTASDVDAEMIADLSRSTFFDTFAEFNTKNDMDKFLGQQFTREKLVEEVSQPWHIFLLAAIGEEVVGYAKLRESKVPAELLSRPAIEIARIYSVRTAIGKGVGKKLMEGCMAIARKKKKQVVWLGVWEKNQRAIDFYKKWGFEKFGEQEFLLGDDLQTDWLMSKEVMSY